MNQESSVRGGALLALALKEKGVQQVYTLAGGFCNPALEGFMRCQIPVVNCPHEQIAGHLADANTRITRQPTVCLIGPEGFANAVPAMLEASGERSPVIFVSGSSTQKRVGSGGFKEIDDVAISTPLVKYAARITDGRRIREFVDRAWMNATQGACGPVHLSLPVDIMFSSFPVDSGFEERPFSRAGKGLPQRARPDGHLVVRLIEMLDGARRPIIIAGHGIWWSGADKTLHDVALRLGIPVFNVPYHRKLLGGPDSNYIGLADIHQYTPFRKALEHADLVMLIGGRLDNQLNFGNPPLIPEAATLVTINGSHEELLLNHRADMGLLADPGLLLQEMANVNRKWTAWLETQLHWRQNWLAEWKRYLDGEEGGQNHKGMHPLAMALAIQGCLEPDDWLVFDGGNTHFWSEIACNIHLASGAEFAGVLHPGNYSLLGVGVPLAVAAKSNSPQSTVALISGDGAFLSGGFAIEVAFQENLPIIVVIDNNGGLDCISQQQERMFESGSHFATDFRDIPFHSMFEGLGGYGELVTDQSDLAAAFARAVASRRPACINARCRGVISPIVAAASDRRERATIE